MKKILLVFILMMISLPVLANNDYFLKKSYILTNEDVLLQRIENLKNEQERYEDLNKDFFYDLTLINDNGEHYIRFTVWKKNEKYKDSDIVEHLHIITNCDLLKEKDFRQNIKVVIELFGGSEGDDLQRVLFDGYFKEYKL